MKKELKELIDIVGEFMNKKEIKGCLVELINNTGEVIIGEIINSDTGYYMIGNTIYYEDEFEENYKILGTLSMIAIEKYILSRMVYIEIFFSHKNIRNGVNEYIGEIPNKEVQFYSESELQELNILLKKLG